LLLGELVCYVVLRRSRTKWLNLRGFLASGISGNATLYFQMEQSENERSLQNNNALPLM